MMVIKALRHIWRTWPIFSPLRKVKYRLHLKRKEWQERLVRFFLYGQRPLSQLYSRRALQEYIDHLDDFVCAAKAPFVPDSDGAVPTEKAPRVIAYYLPQFYAFPQNDAWHGRGFTEWTTAGKGFPMFAGHYQPRIPYDVGFYSLKDTEVMHRQVELAQRYGVSGFCFYYYWFSGKRLMEKPLENFLKDKTLHFPFCLCWACDRWSKRWDGGTQELLMDSYLREDDARRFFADILPFVEDARYIRLAGRPLLQIYHVRQFPHDVYMRFLTELQELAEKEGFRFHISIALTNDMYAEVDYTSIQPADWGADSFVEFPPHGRLRFDDMPRRRDIRFVNPCFHGKIYDMNVFLKNDSMNPLWYRASASVPSFPHGTIRRANGRQVPWSIPILRRSATGSGWKAACATPSIVSTRRNSSSLSMPGMNGARGPTLSRIFTTVMLI